MRHLSVYNRFAMIIAVLTVVFVAALAAQVMVLRDTVIEERRTKVFDIVEAAKKILSNYDEKAKAGKLSAEEARRLAFDPSHFRTRAGAGRDRGREAERRMVCACDDHGDPHLLDPRSL